MAVSTFIGAIGYLYGIFRNPVEGVTLISSFLQASTYSPQPACTLFCHILHHERYIHDCRANHRLVWVFLFSSLYEAIANITL